MAKKIKMNDNDLMFGDKFKEKKKKSKKKAAKK